MKRERLNKSYLLKIAEMGNLFNSTETDIIKDVPTNKIKKLIADAQLTIKKENRINLNDEIALVAMKLIEYTKTLLENSTYRDVIDRLYSLRNLLEPMLATLETVEKQVVDSNNVKNNADDWRYYASILIVNNADYYSNYPRIYNALTLMNCSFEELLTLTLETNEEVIKNLQTIFIVGEQTKMDHTQQVSSISDLQKRINDFSNLPEMINYISDSRKGDNESLINILKDMHLLKYLQYINFPPSPFIIHTKFNIAISAIRQYISPPKLFKSLNEFDTCDQRDFITDIEEFIYQAVYERYIVENKPSGNLFFISDFINYIAYLEEFNIQPRYFTVELINKILFNIVDYERNFNLRILYYTDKIAVKTHFYENFTDSKHIFQFSLDEKCLDIFHFDFNTLKEFIRDSKISATMLGTPFENRFVIRFDTKNKIDNIFKSTLNKDAIHYKKKGHLVDLKGNYYTNSMDNIVLGMLSLLITINNTFVDFPKKEKKRKRLLLYKGIWEFDYFQICERLGNKNISKELDKTIRNFCACRNALYYNCVNTPIIINMIADVNDILNNERREKFMRSLQNASFVGETSHPYTDDEVSKWNKLAQANRFCIESECPYYYGEIEQCMYGEDGVSINEPKKCE